MRCKNCDYALWSLKARTCPECGAPFAPSEFEFVPNAVRFCCPHCDQSYYGTDARGHLVPQTFECVSCQTFVRMDDMVLRPAEGVSESQTQLVGNPWLERRRIGFWRGVSNTVGMSLISAGRLMAGTPVDRAHGQAWLFALLMQSLIVVVAVAPMMLLFGGVGALASGNGSGIAFFAGMTLVQIVMGIVVSMISIAIWGAIAHLVIHLTGGASHGIARTYETLCYASGANVLSAVPCIGGYVGWVWWVVSAVLGIKEAQRISGGRASLAVLAYPVGMLLICGGVYAAFIAMAFSAGTGAGAWTTTTMVYNSGSDQTETQLVADALHAYAVENGSGPPHAAHLLATDHLNAWNFVTSNAATVTSDIPIGNVNLQSLTVAGTPALIKAADSAAAALPPDVIAHRVGNFVFTYHGVDFSAPDPLWTVILSHDPDVAGNGTQVNYFVGDVTGAVTLVPTSTFQASLNAQNALRARYNLPPLPDPGTVTHAEPATPP